VLGFDNDCVLLLRRWSGKKVVTTILNFNTAPVSAALPMAPGRWRKALDSGDPRWQGAGSDLPVEFECAESVELRLPPTSVVLFVRVKQTNKKSGR